VPVPLRQGFVTPEECSIKPPDLDEVQGGVGVWTDETEGAERYVIAIPREGDLGAAVFSVPFDDENLTRNGGLVKLEVGLRYLEALIPPGFPYRTDLSWAGECGQLVLQHVMPGGRVQSFS
jgi:hypothetical protein